MQHSQFELFILVLLLRALVTVGQMPEVFSVSNVTAIFSRNATLHCPFDNVADGHRIAWIRYETRTILSMHGQKVIQSNRYAVETKEGNFDLFITGIIEEDAGTYICQINSEPMQNIMIHLLVMRSPRIESTSPSGTDEVMVEAGGTIKLRCSALGNPKPIITWRRLDGNPLRIIMKDGSTRKGASFNGTSLVLRPVRQIDSGEIMCIASNGFPPIVSHKFRIVVHYKPIISLHIEKVNNGFYPSANIICKIESYPLPDEARLTVAGSLTNALRKIVDPHRMEFHLEGSKHFGALAECFAENKIGPAYTNATIPALDPPPKRMAQTYATEDYSTIYQTTQLSREPEIQMQSGERDNIAGSYYLEDMTPTPKQFIVRLGDSSAFQATLAPPIIVISFLIRYFVIA